MSMHCSMASKQFASGAAQNKAPNDERYAMPGFESHGYHDDRGRLKFRKPIVYIIKQILLKYLYLYS